MSGSVRVVLSFATLPSRIKKINPFLRSLMRQSYTPAAIYMRLCDAYKREGRFFTLEDVPEEIRSDPKISISFGEDCGPLAKLCGALKVEQDPATIVVTADDDRVYPKRWLENLVQYALGHPDVAVGYRGRLVGDNPDYRRFEVIGGGFGKKSVTIPSTVTGVDILTGTGGIAYRRGFFGEEMMSDWARIVNRECPAMFYADDVWISGYLARRGIRCVVIPNRNSIPKLPVLRWNPFVKEENRHFPDSLWLLNRSHHYDSLAVRYFQDIWRRKRDLAPVVPS